MKQGTQVNIRKTGYTDPRFALYNNLQADAARFAAFREAQREHELAAVRTDLDKKRINQKYAEFLKTEKQTIFANAAAAERWMGFTENADIYPNLEYRTAGDKDVRDEHARLDGLILPINDPFWRTHTPPLGFGCRCELVQTDAPANKSAEKYKDYELTTAPRGFDFNPGTSQKLFSDTAGYYTSASKSEAEKLNKQATDFIFNLSKDAVRSVMMGSNTVVSPKGFKKCRLSNSDIKAITGKNHNLPAMRNALLYDIKQVVKEAKFIKSVPDTKGRGNIVAWHYYQVKGMDNMYLNFEEMKSGELKLHAITDKIK